MSWSISRYHAQLVSILTKLPADVSPGFLVLTVYWPLPRKQIQLAISYAPVFSPTSVPITLNNLVFERACVLFNLGALYSQLGGAQDRSNVEGIKRAASNYQVFSGIHDLQFPKLLWCSKQREPWPFCIPPSCQSSYSHQKMRIQR